MRNVLLSNSKHPADTDLHESGVSHGIGRCVFSGEVWPQRKVKCTGQERPRPAVPTLCTAWRHVPAP